MLIIVGFGNAFLLLRLFAKQTDSYLVTRISLDRQQESFLFLRKQLATIIEKESELLMTVAELKQKIADAKTAIQTTVTTEIGEVKAIITGQVGATPAQLIEIGNEVAGLQTTAVAAIQSISDNVAGAPPQP